MKKLYYSIRQNSRNKKGHVDKKAPIMEVEVVLLEKKKIGGFTFCTIAPSMGNGSIRVNDKSLIIK